MKRLEKIPVPILPTFVGALTLGNIYAGMTFTWVRNLTAWAATILIIAYILKIIFFPRTCRQEYGTTVPASLYAGFPMVLMILGSYYFTYAPALGKGIWIAGLVLDAIHIIVFTCRNVIKKRSIDTFLPCWFVTYNGIMVSCVVGGSMNAGSVLRVIVYYGIGIYVILMPIMIWRLNTKEVKPALRHTMAIVLAPCALCLVSYLNVISKPYAVIVYLLYACVLASLLFIIVKLPGFFSVPFAPGFAGMTFPMAIGIVASAKMAAYLTAAGNTALAGVVTQIKGIQIYLTTFIIGYVLLKFLSMALKIKAKEI